MQVHKKKKQKSVRLTSEVIPKEYSITLKPDLEAHTFDGEVKIKLNIKKPTKQIVLHSKELKILYVSVTSKIEQEAKHVLYDEDKETVTFIFNTQIQKGTCTLQIVFTGILSDTMRGFYKSRYHIEGKEHVLATTQFEATDARRCIPCFDEPALKAVFYVNLVVPTNKVAISNTLPTEIKEHEAGFKIVSFAPTPKMSTYLLAFIVGDFEFIEAKTKNGVIVRVHTTPGKKEQGAFALDVAVRCLEFYEAYFDIPYPLNTLDMIAIPDFESGAMENWGAITYRETTLLVDPKLTATRVQQYVAIVVAHELAHQWFGNLVTMEWWTHLWLNEGFASYIEYMAVDHLFPEWHMWEQFLVEDHNAALSLDALSNTHAIEIPVHHPGEIGEIFDKISYSKGASVIRMLAQYVGRDDFRDGLRYYLKKHSYKNTETIDLWDAFEKVSGKPVRKMMHTWTYEPGFPVVTITEKKDTIVFEQSRFILSSKKNIQTRWMVPYSLFSDRGEVLNTLLYKKSIALPKPQTLWWKGNTNESSFVITRYSDYKKLILPIAHKRLPAVDRLGIIRDLHFLVRRGDVSAVMVIEFLEHFKEESEYIVWVEIVSLLSTLKSLVYTTVAWKHYKSFVGTLITPSIHAVGFDKRTNDTHTDILLRSMLLSVGGVYQIPEILKYAKRLFVARAKNPIDPNLRGYVYTTLARENTPSIYKTLRQMYTAAEMHEEKNRILNGICMVSNAKLLEETLSFIQSKEVRLQDRFRAYALLLHNPDTQESTWRYMKKNWQIIKEQFGETSHTLSRILESLEDMATKNAYKDISQFFSKHPVRSAERTIRQVLEMIQLNEKFKIRNKKKLVLWLTKNSKK